MTVRSRAAAVRDSVRTQLWPAPTAGILLALLAGVLLPRLDRTVDDLLPGGITELLFGGGASAARTVLDAVAGSLITVTSLTFSLTVVTLQLASGQFSPRLLRTFARDRFVHITLALFLATFVYALTVLRTVRSPDEQRDQFVPQISVTIAFVLAVASVVALVLFLAHLAREIRVETMLHSVHKDATASVARLLPANPSADDSGADSATPAVPIPPADATLILAEDSGFFTAVDHVGLCQAASASNVFVLVDRLAGAFVVAGTPLGRYWRRSDSSASAGSDAIEAAIRSVFTISMERDDTQDYSFGLRQLTDVTTKALSPGVNDPTTAVHSLGHTSALMCEIARQDLRDLVRCDGDGQLRVVCRRPSFAQMLDEVVCQPRRYGAADPAVISRLLELLKEVGWSVRAADQRAAVDAQLTRVLATMQAQDFDETERVELNSLARDAQDALRGQWTIDR